MASQLARNFLTSLGELITELLHLIYPETCIGCETSLQGGEACLCINCQLDLPETHFQLDSNNPVAQRFWGRVKLTHASSYLVFQKKGLVQKIMHAFKYRNRPDAAQWLGYQYGKKLKQVADLSNVDCILPVPMQYKKQRARGYNQSEMIANGISEALQTPVLTRLLIKVKKTQTQTRKSRYNRWKNTENVFEIVPNSTIPKHVLLVDDVITTGSTLEACVITLLKAFPKVQISAVSLACS